MILESAKMDNKQTPGSSFNAGHNVEMGVHVELIVNDRAEAMIFHDKPFSSPVSWLEYDLDSSKLDFVLDDGELRDFGIPVHPNLAKYMQNAFQVLMVQMDEKTGEPLDGGYLPLIIHRA